MKARGALLESFIRPNVVSAALRTRVADKIAGKLLDGDDVLVGAAKDDNHFAEAMKLGAKWRKQANRENW